MFGWVRRLIEIVGIFLLCVCSACSEEKPAAAQADGSGSASGLEASGDRSGLAGFVGSHARLVWTQQVDESGDDPFVVGDGHRLMGLDTADGRGERPLLASTGNFHKPLLTTDGSRVVFSNRGEGTVWVVDWTGTGLRKVAEGYLASDIWRDPATDREWVYALAMPVEGDAVSGGPVVRFPLDGPFERVMIWDQSQVSLNNIQSSADGIRFSGQFPWPYAGIANIEKQAAKSLGRGCWTSMCPDNSYRMWVFDGPHRNLLIWEFGAGRPKKINISEVAGEGVYEVYHPRWSNHPRYMVMTGPYKVGDDRIRIFSGGTEVEVYVARFDDGFAGIESSLRVTTNTRADYFPDLWVASAAGMEAPRGVNDAAVTGGTQWPAVRDGMVYIWEDGSKPNLIPGRGGLGAGALPEPRGSAIFGRFFEMQPRDGLFEAAAESLGGLWGSGGGGMSWEAWWTPAVDGGLGDEVTQRWFWRMLDADQGMLMGLAQTGEGVRAVMSQGGDAEILSLAFPVADMASAHHLMLTLDVETGRWVAYLDGARVAEAVFEERFRLESWHPVRWIFGDGGLEVAGGPTGWHGRLEGVAVYSRALLPLEVSEQAAAARTRAAERVPAERFEVVGTLAVKSAIPAPEALAPYRRGLVLHEYRLDGPSVQRAGADRVLVAHWGVLDGRKVPDIWRVGESYPMVLERFEEHPELESERMSMEDVALDAPWFYEVTPRQADPKAARGRS